jgi:hypothetical protein
VGSLEELLRLRSLVDALLRRTVLSIEVPAPSAKTRAMPQLNLMFTDIPIPESCLWEQLSDEHKQIVIEALARLIVQAARTNNRKEQTND